MTDHVHIRGVDLAYRDLGSGRVVLDAHGLTSSRASVARLGLGDFSAVGTQQRLISYDARGHGESGGALVPDEYTWPNLADDLLALADHFSPERAVSGIGLSMGTATLLHAACKAPKRFERLVLTAPPTAWDTRVAQAKLYETMAQLAETNTPDELAAYFSKGLIAPIFRDVPGYPTPPDIAHDRLPAVFRGAGRSDFPAPEALRALPQRTLILAWDSDAGHPVSTAQKLLELLPHAELHIAKTSAEIRTWGERAAKFLAS